MTIDTKIDELLNDFADGIAAEEAWADAKRDIKALMAEGYKQGYIQAGLDKVMTPLNGEEMSK